jgi:hypothetical protein
MTDGEMLIDIAGTELTNTVTLDDAEHPPTLVPVTVYAVVAPGVTTIEAEVDPVPHRYESAPEAVRVTDAPEQITELEAEIEIDGAALTVIVSETVAEQPELLVPVQL